MVQYRGKGVNWHCSRNVWTITGDPLHSRAACTQPCNVNTHSRAHCSPGARLCEQWGHGCVNNGARLCAMPGCVEGHPWQWLIQHSWYSIWIYETRSSATFSKLLHGVLFLIPRPYNVPLSELCEFNPHFEHDRFSASLLVVYVSCAKASKLNTKYVFYFTTSLP